MSTIAFSWIRLPQRKPSQRPALRITRTTTIVRMSGIHRTAPVAPGRWLKRFISTGLWPHPTLRIPIMATTGLEVNRAATANGLCAWAPVIQTSSGTFLHPTVVMVPPLRAFRS